MKVAIVITILNAVCLAVLATHQHYGWALIPLVGVVFGARSAYLYAKRRTPTVGACAGE